jgi:hypothetical protein
MLKIVNSEHKKVNELTSRFLNVKMAKMGTMSVSKIQRAGKVRNSLVFITGDTNKSVNTFIEQS